MTKREKSVQLSGVVIKAINSLLCGRCRNFNPAKQSASRGFREIFSHFFGIGGFIRNCNGANGALNCCALKVCFLFLAVPRGARLHCGHQHRGGDELAPRLFLRPKRRPALLTQRYDNARSGCNTGETTLNTSNVVPGKFGKLFSREVAGEIYAQPLIVAGLKMPTGGRAQCGVRGDRK